ncbi:MAG: hypothetical protein JO292_10415 [Betaproteobacteria bacterium]|nr:hypothetical protein [Betaproteobacteria bacterium]
MAEIKGVRKESMKQWPGKRFRIRPKPFERLSHINFVSDKRERDDLWLVLSVNDELQRVQLQNLGTYHTVEVPFDSIREYRQDTQPTSGGFLLLKAQLILKGGEWELDPIA